MLNTKNLPLFQGVKEDPHSWILEVFIDESIWPSIAVLTTWIKLADHVNAAIKTTKDGIVVYVTGTGPIANFGKTAKTLWDAFIIEFSNTCASKPQKEALKLRFHEIARRLYCKKEVECKTVEEKAKYKSKMKDFNAWFAANVLPKHRQAAFLSLQALSHN